MRKLLHLFIIASMLMMSACSGEDGEVGPKGDPGADGAVGDKGDTGDQGIPGDYSAKLGYFEGTVSGKRTDGTAFSYPFKFEFAYGGDMYDGNILDLNRFETFGGAVAYKTTGYTFDVEKGYALFSTFVDNGDWEPFDFRFGFVKELTSTTLFKLQAAPYDQEVNYDRLIELSPEKNGIYNFPLAQPGTLIYFEADTDRDNVADAWSFQVNGTDTYVYYSMETGELLFVETLSGVQTTGTLVDKYNDIKFVMEDTFKEYVFVNTADNSPAWEYVETVPADAITVTNYLNQEGVISFDFNVTISKYRGYLMSSGGWGGWLQNGVNSTRHDLTITGKFNSGGKVYESAVGRLGSN